MSSVGRACLVPTLAALYGGIGAATIAPAALAAHAVVYPRTSVPGAYEKYVLRVPNERDVATVRVSLVFPSGVRVVAFAEVPGWVLEIERDREGRVRGATWTGALPVGRFVEFPFVAVNPDAETRLTWPATQVYADGEEVAWAGPEGTATPASVTVLRREGDAARGAWYVAGAALVASLLALGVALRRGSTVAA